MKATPRTHLLRYISVDAGVLTLGYFQANLACMGILVVLSYYAVILYALVVENIDMQRHFERFHMGLVSLLLLFFGLCLVLAIALIAGVKKRHPGYVLAYFMSGVVMTGCLVLIWTKLMFCDSYYFFDEAPLSIFISFFIYMPFLMMVNTFYYNVNLEKDPDHTPYKTLPEGTTMEFKKDIV